MLKMLDPASLEEHCMKKLSEFLSNVDNEHFVWLEEIREEALKMLNSSDGEPELMPKTPSQKNRRKKKRFSSVKNGQVTAKRLSKRDGTRSTSSERASQRLQHKKDLETRTADIQSTFPCCVTRSQSSNASLQNPTIDLARGRIPLVEISSNERCSAELQMEKASQSEKVALPLVLSSDKSPIKKLQSLSKVSLLVGRDTPEAKTTEEGREACKLKIANIAKTTDNEEPSTREEKLPTQPPQQESQSLKRDSTQSFTESPQTPTAPKANRRSVRRSLIRKASTTSRASLAERYSLSNKRERMIQKSIRKTLSNKTTARQSSSSCKDKTAIEKKEGEDITESRPKLDPASRSQEVGESTRMSLRSQKANMTAVKPVEKQQEKESREDSSEKTEIQKQPLSARRKPSYKRAVNELNDGHHTEDECSPPRKKAVSPQFGASKVVRPFKTFLHTVQKNQMLMMTPGSASRNGTMKSFLKQNTPLRTNPKEKEKQRLETLRRKEEAEQQRKQKLEEEKRRRLEEIKRKREERLQKVLLARERVEQMEEEKKRRLEQKLAQHEEKNEKVREERMAEEKKKKAAVKKKEELEALRKQEDEACKRRALQLEEEEHRRKELMQKKKEEEEDREKARKIAEQRQAELERETERELEKKREQEKLRAQREHERQEKEKAARLQKELMAAKEQLGKEAKEKEKKLQEQRKQEEGQQKASLESGTKAANRQLNVTIDIEASPTCNSYQMTPQGPKCPKIDVNNYGMDLNSDDSTDDESDPRKPIPAWATGNQLSQAILHQYYKPPNTRALFGVVRSPKLEEIFYKCKPRYFKRTSSAVWNSPPFSGGK